MDNKGYRIQVAGEGAFVIYFDNLERGKVSPAIAARVHQAKVAIEASLGKVLIDLIPSYASLLVVFDPLVSDSYWIKSQIRVSLAMNSQTHSSYSNQVELPVYYGPEVAIDLPRIAKITGLPFEQIIQLHSDTVYTVYAIGFAPGFGYLGEVPAQLSVPRIDTPRAKVKKGSVAIAEQQTAVYPADSPGGWNIIGSCPLDMFNTALSTPTLFTVGDRIKFVPIDKQEFVALGGVLQGSGS